MLTLNFFWTKCSANYDFLEIYEIFNMTTVQICAAKCDSRSKWQFFCQWKKIYNEITEIKYMKFVKLVGSKIKSICGLLNTNKDKNTFVFGWIAQYMLIKACIYIVVLQQKYLQN